MPAYCSSMCGTWSAMCERTRCGSHLSIERKNGVLDEFVVDLGYKTMVEWVDHFKPALGQPRV